VESKRHQFNCLAIFLRLNPCCLDASTCFPFDIRFNYFSVQVIGCQGIYSQWMRFPNLEGSGFFTRISASAPVLQCLGSLRISVISSAGGQISCGLSRPSLYQEIHSDCLRSVVNVAKAFLHCFRSFDSALLRCQAT